MTPLSLRIAWIHPELGIGGAERLVVDAMKYLKDAGHRPVIYTCLHDTDRCFAETTNGELEVRVRGDTLPRSIAKRLQAPCTIMRMRAAAAALVREEPAVDVICCDLVPHCIPILKRANVPVLYYCHFPDLLLAPFAAGWRKVYRTPIDRYEEATTAMASRLLVNSKFTSLTFDHTFPSLRNMKRDIVYPGVDTDQYKEIAPLNGSDGDIEILSINRYVAAKNLPLALQTLRQLIRTLDEPWVGRLKLVIAGGFDRQIDDNRETLTGLRNLALELGISERVRFETSINEERKVELMRRARCILYTPINEHFGYGPVEAMAAARPIVATDSGGTLETVVHGETGFLVPPDPQSFAAATARVVVNPQLARKMGLAGRQHVSDHFSLDRFGQAMDETIRTVARSEPRRV